MNAKAHRKLPSHQAIVRAVASSTAIETGQRIAEIEAALREGRRTFAHLSLALKPAPKPARG
ncbi:MAG: hypothetical protein AB1735_04320 [Pseudomonadota bacterium]